MSVNPHTEERAPDYSFLKLSFMRPPGPHVPVSEGYVTCPPALVIRDTEGNLWTLGFDQGGYRTGEYEYDVVRNGRKTGEYACRIEYRAGRLRIFGQAGWRVWNGRYFI